MPTTGRRGGWAGRQPRQSPGVWLVTWRKASGRPVLTYDDAVSEALAFGWIDTKGGSVDDERTRLMFAPRKRAAAGRGRTSSGSSGSRRTV